MPEIGNQMFPNSRVHVVPAILARLIFLLKPFLKFLGHVHYHHLGKVL